MKPALTIVTICYRNPEDLKRTLDSLAPLDSETFELLVIDGSPDNLCAAVARRYPQARHLHERDRGKYDAMNKGIRAATGDSLLFMNSGDMLASPDVLRRLVVEHRSKLVNTVIYGDAIRIVGGENILVPAPQLDERNLRLGVLPSHQSTLIPTAFHRLNLYDESMHFAADTKFLKGAYRQLPYRHVLLPIGMFIYGGASTSPGSWRLLHKQYRELVEAGELRPLERVAAALSLIRRKLFHIVGGEARLQAIQAKRLRRKIA